MSTIKETAEQFFDACETGKGWEGCEAYCHPGATFSAQAWALDGVETLQGYTEWMKGLLTPVPDGHYPRSRSGAAPGLAHGQGVGQTVHAGAIAAGGNARAQGHWDRRDCDPQGTYVPHRGQ